MNSSLTANRGETKLDARMECRGPGRLIATAVTELALFALAAGAPASAQGALRDLGTLGGASSFALAVNEGYRGDYSRLFAGLTLAMLPVLVVYAVFQRQVQSGLTAGQLK